MDTRHEVDQLVLELQKVKQEVSGPVCVSWRRWWRLRLPSDCGREAQGSGIGGFR